MYGYIYLTTNNINGRKYIGQHKSTDGCLDKGYLGSGKILKQAIKLYGRQNFSIEILETVQTLEEANQKEIYYINKYNAMNDPLFYNIAQGGNIFGCNKGKKVWNSGLSGQDDDRIKLGTEKSLETKKKNLIDRWSYDTSIQRPDIDYALLNNEKPICQEIHHKKYPPSKLKGRKLPEDVKKKISESKKGKKKTKEQIEKMRIASIGNKSAKRCSVMCVETGQVFESMAEAARYCGLKTYSQISMCVKDQNKTSGGVHWKLVEESE